MNLLASSLPAYLLADNCHILLRLCKKRKYEKGFIVTLRLENTHQ